MLEKLETPVPLLRNCEIEPPGWITVHPNSPPDDSVAHEVREGESLVSIANEPRYARLLSKLREAIPAGLCDDLPEEMANARALIYFNFHTVVPEYVNWYLLNITCCYHATEDRCNRRFSNHDRSARSPLYGKITRAGKIYIPKEKVKPKPKPIPEIRKVHFWARLAYQDGLFKWLRDLAGIGTAGSTADTLLDTLEEVIKRTGTEWTPEQLRQIARLKKFARPLRYALKAAKYAGWAATAADLILGGRIVTGYLVMSYEEPFDTHVAWEVDMVLKGKNVLGEDGGAFTTYRDTYDIRTSVFDPESQWKEKELSATMTGGSFGLSILNAFRTSPVARDPARRSFAGSRFVVGRPGPLDWTLSLRSMHSLGGGLAFYHTLPFLESRIRNGRRRTHTSIMDV